MAEEIRITVHEDGRVEIHGHGFKGKSCDALDRLAETLGEVEDVKHLPEYSQSVKAEEHLRRSM